MAKRKKKPAADRRESKKSRQKSPAGRTKGGGATGSQSAQSTSKGSSEDTSISSPPISPQLRIGALIALGILGLVSYLPNFLRFVDRWSSEPDYSHGFFVLPFIVYCLFVRRREFPDASPTLAYTGLVLIFLGSLMRVIGGGLYIDAIEDWSLMVWVAGCVWLLFGWQAFRWSLPFVIFLFFMIPLPFRLEEGMALPLQRTAAKLSTWTLQVIGQPALDQGNTITVGTNVLEVRRACSGLRIFMSMIAVGVGMIMLFPERPRWQKGLLLLATLPIALVANATRIVVTGLLYQYTSGDLAKHFSHDFAGYAMIVYAIFLFIGLLKYSDLLFPVVPSMAPLQQRNPTN